ncbi:RsmB/NOP family class I SAM-dependent RNA methyltransferase [Tepidicella baoligensis]|uniref:RsmB/NOP family class I SAM-dependent RNA methyltransferase n=1 Tax=Tepidicella baoligensis TaxID=2707016 RepID=UPI0015D972F9|nr:RsmB/NOP family class I SAM-dependent RNA methyltransferase [Tepidicella baoligensis]
MHPPVLNDLGATLMARVLTFEHPADATVAQFFREHPKLGARDRHLLSDQVFHALRALPLPGWLEQALRSEVGAGYEALVAALGQPAPLDLRVNGLKAKRPAVRQQLLAAGVEAADTPYSPWGLRLQGKPSLRAVPAYRDGLVEVQDEGSQLLALLVEPKRHDTVVDFCAGAGGKTLALGALMRNQGRLYAFDTSAHRLEALKPRLARSGITDLQTMVLAHERDERLQRLAGKVDRVLVDAPCSGLGTLRRSPDLKARRKPQDVAAFSDLQARILAAAARLVKPGGRLVYATCSLLRQENEQMAEAFSAAHRDFVPLDAAERLAHAGVAKADTLCRSGYLRLWPHLHQTDGFFAALWQRRP